MRYLTLLLVLWCASQETPAQQSPADNRLPKDITHFYFPIAPPDEVEALEIIRSANDPALSKAMQGPISPGNLRLKWHERISLKDADYNLYLFDSSFRINPGTTPRVLVLLDGQDHLRTWAKFDCRPESNFGYGVIVQQRIDSQLGPKTYFVTVNTSDPYGYLNGSLFFEKYAIFSDHIEKLGENLELTSIKD